MAAYRITARSLERQLVGESVLKEFKSLEDCSVEEIETEHLDAVHGKFVLVLEEEESVRPSLPRAP